MKGKGTGNATKQQLRKQLDTIVYPQTNHTIVYQGCSWTTPLKNCLSDVVQLGLNKASYILGNWAFMRIRRNIIRKVKEETLVIKGKGKGND